MGKVDFYNDNANRAYPFVTGTVHSRPPGVPLTVKDLPNGLIVDAGFLMGLQSGYDAELHEVYLHEIRRQGTTFFIEFRSTAPGLFERPLIFTREIGDNTYAVEYVDNFQEPVSSESASSSFSASGSEGPCPPEPLWSGFLVTGKLSAFETALPADDEITRTDDDDGLLEPALIQSMVVGYIDSLNVANNDRTRVTAPEDCPPVVWDYPTDIVYVRDTCIRGDVRLRPGFNTIIVQNQFENSLTITPSVGAGAGQPCESVPLFNGEMPPDDSILLEGGPTCGDVLRSINGKSGRVIEFLAEQGVTISPDPENHRLTINVDMTGLALCYESDVSQVSEQL